MGYLADWKVPTSDRVSETFRYGNYAYSAATNDIAIVYNVNKLTPEEIKNSR